MKPAWPYLISCRIFKGVLYRHKLHARCRTSISWFRPYSTNICFSIEQNLLRPHRHSCRMGSKLLSPRAGECAKSCTIEYAATFASSTRADAIERPDSGFNGQQKYFWSWPYCRSDVVKNIQHVWPQSVDNAIVPVIIALLSWYLVLTKSAWLRRIKLLLAERKLDNVEQFEDMRFIDHWKIFWRHWRNSAMYIDLIPGLKIYWISQGSCSRHKLS